MNTFGNKFRVSVFGESHADVVGVLLDGVPAGLSLTVEDFKSDLDRRRADVKGTTPRREEDVPTILSGVLEGYTTGAPVAITFANLEAHSEDYASFRDCPRPGHADFAASRKFWDFNDLRGGGHFSGRMTLALVAAGVVAKKIADFSYAARLVEVGGQSDSTSWDAAISAAQKEGDSLGGVVECVVGGVPVGLGEPFFDSVEAVISHLVFSIPGVRGIEFGDGFKASSMKGSQHNDPIMDAEGHTAKNGAGGVNGGLSNGNDIVFRVAFKPTSSIAKAQNTYNFVSGKIETLTCKGRHDACFALRTPVVVEACAAIAFANFIL
ncbi:MAG: chorismate synthase [Bacteroidales bacterium]|nr:chorismate synthase [Bacteroidales bacterium]